MLNSTSPAATPVPQASHAHTGHTAHPAEASRENYLVSQDGYEVRVIPPSDGMRTRVDALVETMYLSKGLGTPFPFITRRDNEKIIIAHAGGRLVGTLTVGIDSDSGLLADMLYNDCLDTIRARGGKVCELSRFAVDPGLRSPHLLTAIFALGFIVGRFLHGASDGVIEVNPRHASYYNRRFGYQVIGPERQCPRVNAPAVLMHTSLIEAEETIRRGEGSRYQCSPALLDMLMRRNAAAG